MIVTRYGSPFEITARCPKEWEGAGVVHGRMFKEERTFAYSVADLKADEGIGEIMEAAESVKMADTCDHI